MRFFYWLFARFFEKDIAAECRSSYAAGYNDGYNKARVPEGAHPDKPDG